MEYPSPLGPLAFQHPIVSIQLSKNVEPRPQTPPDATKPILDAQPTSSPQDSSYHAVSEAFENLQPCNAAPMIATNVEKNDKSDVHIMLGFFLGQCATQAPHKDPVMQRRQEADIFARVLNAVIPICNRRRIKDGVKDYCKEVQVEEDRYRVFVELFNNVLQDTENIKDAGLRGRSLDILFHLNYPSEVKAAHSSMETIQKPDTEVTQPDATKTVGAPEEQNTTREEFTAEIALEQPDVSFSWSDVLAVAEFKLGLKYCRDPPEMYGTQRTKEIPHIENIRRPLRIRSAGQVSALSKTSKPRAILPPKPLNVIELRNLRQAQQRAQQLATEKSTEDTRNINITNNEADKRGTRSQPSAGSEQSSEQTDSGNNTVSPVVQTALYGADMLCRGPHTSHAITLLILDDVAWIWWFDRQGAIQSAGINFVQDLPYFVVLLVAFQRFELEHWGIIGALQPREDSFGDLIFNVEFPDKDLVVSALPRADIYGHYTLTGRCTRVYTAMGAVDDQGQSISKNLDIGKGLSDMVLVLKIYWPESSRPNEALILEKARELGESNPAIKNHIPELLAVYNHVYSTGTIRSRLGVEAGGKGPLGRPRDLRILLFKLLQPLNPRKLSIPDFMRGWKHCLMCHFYLWKGGIEHGDISLGNLMWDEEKKNGVLGDYDLATLRDGSQENDEERTGTIPFMAIDLLDKDYFNGKIQRLYRHDVESFIWVLIWMSLRNDEAWNKQWWNTSNYNTCRVSKWSFVSRELKQVEAPTAEGGLWDLVIALIRWVRLVNDQPVEGARRGELSNELVFKEVTTIIDSNWVWK